MYFDNSATTLIKPKALAEKYYEVLTSGKYGSPTRGSHEVSQNSLLAVYQTKKDLAELFGIKDPNDITFSQNASYALNFIIKSLVKKEDHVITSMTEHNSVLRPLYQAGCDLSFLDFNEKGELKYEDLPGLLKENTKFLVINHASNLLANVNDLDRLHDFCRENGLIMITDLAQSAGNVEMDLSKYDKSLFAFTGHKSLYGPTGLGGIVKVGDFDFKPVFAGGSGIKSFSKTHPEDFPTVFDIGTENFIGEIAFDASIKFILDTGLDKMEKKKRDLTQAFYNGVYDIPGVKIYSKKPEGSFSPLVSLNIRDLPSSEVSLILDEKYDIQTRPGAHCAPLIHEKLGTVDQGLVRFSFSYFNEMEEIEEGIRAVKEIANNY